MRLSGSTKTFSSAVQSAKPEPSSVMPMSAMPAGRVSSFRLVQPANIPAASAVSLSGSVIVSSAVHPAKVLSATS